MTKPQRHPAPLRRPRLDHMMQVVDRHAIRRSRMARRWTQLELANLVGCSRQFIGFIESGEKDRVAEKLAMRLAKELDLDWRAVFGDSDSSARAHSEDRLHTANTMSPQTDQQRRAS